MSSVVFPVFRWTCWWIRLIFIKPSDFCPFILLSHCSLFQTLLFCGWPINLSPQPLPSLLSFSCAQHFLLLPGLLVRLPPQLRCLPAALVACWPFLRLDFRVHFCVSNIHFYLEGFNTSVSFCRTAHLNVVSSTSLPSSLVIAGFWALQPWRSVRTSLSLHTALPFSSWEKNTFISSLKLHRGCPFHWLNIGFAVLPAPASLPWLPAAVVSSAGILLFRLISWLQAN